MACMTHTCIACGEVVINNSAKQECPVCGGVMIRNFDEDVKDHEPDDFEEMNRNEAEDYKDEN